MASAKLNREHAEGTTGSDEILSETPWLDHALVLSFGKCATDNLPSAETLTFRDLVERFSTPDIARGSLSAADYHALDRADPAQKTKRYREKDGPYFVPITGRHGSILGSRSRTISARLAWPLGSIGRADRRSLK
jgi:hypothetical protein